MAALTVPLAPAETLGTYTVTTDATQTTAGRFVCKEDGAYFVNLKVVAVRTSDYAQAATYWKQACFNYKAGGGLTILSTVPGLPTGVRSVVTDNESDSAWAVTMDGVAGDVDGDGANEYFISVLVTGKASTTIAWRVVADIFHIT